jgi:thiol-disulfide isomerase/thioredoxin
MEFLKEPRALPDVQFLDGQGRAVTLSDFHGKVVLLNVWATWCPPCRDEMPSLDRLQAKLGGPDFEVVALSIDEGGPFAVRSFYDELGLEALAVYIDQTVRAADKLGTPGLPTTFLVDRQGRVVATAVGPEEWDSQPVVAMIRRVSRTR